MVINSLDKKKWIGIRVFNLSAGEPKLVPHPLIVQAVLDALEQGKIFYPPVLGFLRVKIIGH